MCQSKKRHGKSETGCIFQHARIIFFITVLSSLFSVNSYEAVDYKGKKCHGRIFSGRIPYINIRKSVYGKNIYKADHRRYISVPFKYSFYRQICGYSGYRIYDHHIYFICDTKGDSLIHQACGNI